MHCKHPVFSVTWSLSSGSQVDRSPVPTSIPGETKALTSSSPPTVRSWAAPDKPLPSLPMT